MILHRSRTCYVGPFDSEGKSKGHGPRSVCFTGTYQDGIASPFFVVSVCESPPPPPLPVWYFDFYEGPYLWTGGLFQEGLFLEVCSRFSLV